jgi:hypothetical protein
MIEIPSSYTTSKFYAYADRPTQSRNYLNGGCPICKEGDSRGRKKRLYYFPNENYLYCHNCVRSWTPYFWIREITGWTFKEIMADVKDYTGIDPTFKDLTDDKEKNETIFELPPLPGECVNLLDPSQIKFYKNLFIVDIALSYCKKRRLFTACNRPKTFYACVQDNFHRNRLVIPYYDELGKIECYSTRQLLDNDTRAKYLIKFNSDKPVFNLHKIDSDYPFIFIFEGAIDAMFVKNGVAISGVSMTDNQEQSINSLYPFHKKIWVLDNFRKEEDEVKNKIKEKLKEGQLVFLYDGEFEEFKDLNEYCIKQQVDGISPDLIIKNSYKGMEGLMKIH